MFTKEEIEREIASLDEQLKTAPPLERGRLEASRRVWLGRLVTWKAGGYKNEAPEPDQDEAEDAPMEGSEPQPKPRRRRK